MNLTSHFFKERGTDALEKGDLILVKEWGKEPFLALVFVGERGNRVLSLTPAFGQPATSTFGIDLLPSRVALIEDDVTIEPLDGYGTIVDDAPRAGQIVVREDGDVQIASRHGMLGVQWTSLMTGDRSEDDAEGHVRYAGWQLVIRRPDQPQPIILATFRPPPPKADAR